MLPVAVVLALSLAGAAAAPRYDYLLEGGHVIDPKNGIDGVMDVAVAGARIARVAAAIPGSEARRTIDVRGLYVTPGLIDLHAHVHVGSAFTGSVPADAFSFRSGVTTMVDAGTAGARTFADFRTRIIDRSQTRVLALVNIAADGMGTGHEDDLAGLDVAAAVATARAHRDVVVGFKTAHFAGPGWESVDAAVAAGRQTNLPVMVDFGFLNAVRNLRTLLEEKLRPGDIYTHCYSGHRTELRDDGTINPAMVGGRRRGVIFDLGFGAGSFYWYVAVPLTRQGFYPDSISTDLHTGSMNGGMKTMVNAMSEVLALGAPLERVVAMSTWAPAQQIRRPRLGTLDPGAEADVAVLRLDSGKFGFLDSAGAVNAGRRSLTCELTLRAGKVVWDLNGRAAEGWQTFPYQRRRWEK